MPVLTRKRKQLINTRNERVCGLVQGCWLCVFAFLDFAARTKARCVCRSLRALHNAVPLPLFCVDKWLHNYPLPEAGVHMVMLQNGCMAPSVLINFKTSLRRTRSLTVSRWSSFYTPQYMPSQCPVEELTVNKLYLTPHTLNATWKRMKKLDRIHADELSHTRVVPIVMLLGVLKRHVPTLTRLTYNKMLGGGPILKDCDVDGLRFERLNLDAVI